MHVAVLISYTFLCRYVINSDKIYGMESWLVNRCLKKLVFNNKETKFLVCHFCICLDTTCTFRCTKSLRLMCSNLQLQDKIKASKVNFLIVLMSCRFVIYFDLGHCCLYDIVYFSCWSSDHFVGYYLRYCKGLFYTPDFYGYGQVIHIKPTFYNMDQLSA